MDKNHRRPNRLLWLAMVTIWFAGVAVGLAH
jgi:hypothetical protein